MFCSVFGKEKNSEMKRDNILKFELREKKEIIIMIIVIIMIKKERINSAIKVQKEQESKHQGTKPKAIVYSN